jgi:tetratricopeptide (TPR) repeat protein
MLSEWQLRSHEGLREEAAKRNHLIRRAMARSLARALRAAEDNEDLSVLVPKDLRDEFFEIWPSLLERCQNDDNLVEDLFPLSLSEDQWTILNSFYDDLTDPNLASQPEELRERLAAQEVVSQRALARLISRLPLERDPSEPLSLFGRQLEQVWPPSDSEAFALKLLPLYRMAFASLCSEGGPESSAIFLKGQKATLAELRELHSLLENLDARLVEFFRATKKESERIRNTVREEGEKTRQEIRSLDDVIRRAVAEAMEKALSSGALPAAAAAAEKKQELIEQAVQEIPKVAEELRQSNSPVATSNVESLLASGHIQEARALAQSQFDQAHKARQASDAAFAQACYDMGRINELSFHWTAALDNYRQAWKLSRERNSEIGFRLAFLTATLCNYDEAIATYNSVLPLLGKPYDTARTLINLGGLHAECNRRADAEKMFLDVLRISQPQTGPADLGLVRLAAMALVNLGILYQNEGNLEKAAKAYSDAMAILVGLSKIVGESGLTDLAYALVNMGDLWLDQGCYEDAERSFTVALAWMRKSRGRLDRESRLHEGKLLASLGELYEATARQEHSENALKEALSVFHGSDDSVSPVLADHEARTLVNIGNFYARSGRLQEAELSVVKAIALFRELTKLSPSTFEPRLAIAYASLGSIYLQNRDFDKAIVQFSEQLAILKKQIASDTESSKSAYLEALVDFSRLNISVSNLEAAEQQLCEGEELIRNLVSSSPERWGDTYARILEFLALIRFQKGFPVDALNLAHRAYEFARDDKIKMEVGKFIAQFDRHGKSRKPFWTNWFK